MAWFWFWLGGLVSHVASSVAFTVLPERRERRAGFLFWFALAHLAWPISACAGWYARRVARRQFEARLAEREGDFVEHFREKLRVEEEEQRRAMDVLDAVGRPPS